MSLHLLRKRPAADRPEGEQQRPFVCVKCEKKFAYVEAFKSHCKQSPGCIHADLVRRDEVAQAQHSAGTSDHVLQPPWMRHDRPSRDHDPALIDFPDVPAAHTAQCGETVDSAIASHAHPHVPSPDSATGRHGHHSMCQADIACLEATEQQSPRDKRPVPQGSSQACVGARAATFSQAVVLPALAALPGRARNCLLKGINDPRFDSREVGGRWPDNKAYVDEMDELQVVAGNCHESSAYYVCRRRQAYAHTRMHARTCY